jgi:hypothetical protein
VKGASGYTTQDVGWPAAASQQAFGCADPLGHALGVALIAPIDTGCDVVLTLPFDTLPVQATTRVAPAPSAPIAASQASGRRRLWTMGEPP